MTIINDQITNDATMSKTVADKHIASAKAFIEQAEAAGNAAARRSATTALDLAVGAKTTSEKASNDLPGSPEQQTYQKMSVDYLNRAERALTEAETLLQA